jgi:hypothetical protein
MALRVGSELSVRRNEKIKCYPTIVTVIYEIERKIVFS